MKDKKFLRSKFIQIRKDCFDDYGNKKIFFQVVNLIDNMYAKSIFSYFSFGQEVDTHKIIENYFGKKIIFMPYTNNKEMTPLQLLKLDNLKCDKLGNLPIESYGNCAKAIDITIVPMLAFNKDCYRLGYGGGYYDKFLSKNKTFSIGLAFDEQLTSELQTESFDRQLDCIVTQTKIFRR